MVRAPGAVSLRRFPNSEQSLDFGPALKFDQIEWSHILKTAEIGVGPWSDENIDDRRLLSCDGRDLTG